MQFQIQVCAFCIWANACLYAGVVAFLVTANLLMNGSAWVSETGS